MGSVYRNRRGLSIWITFLSLCSIRFDKNLKKPTTQPGGWVGLEDNGLKDPLCVRRWQSEGGAAQTYTKHTKSPYRRIAVYSFLPLMSMYICG